MAAILWDNTFAYYHIESILMMNNDTLSPTPLTLYFSRHGRTVANETDDYNASTLNVMSETGQQQIERLTQTLLTMEFDEIITSPVRRVQLTIFPYLKASGRTAEIWRELTECCWQPDRATPAHTNLPMGNPVETLSENHFTFRDDSCRYHVHDDANFQDGIKHLHQAADLIRERYFNSGKRLLVVAHHHCGDRFLKILQGQDPTEADYLENATVYPFRQNGHGLIVPVE